MVRLEYSDVLKRKIRKDPLDEIGVSTRTKIKEAIVAGRNQEALDLVDYTFWEGKTQHDVYVDWIYHNLTMVADKLGEEEVYHFVRATAELFRKEKVLVAVRLPLEELVAMDAENMRAHRSGPGQLGNVTAVEEKEKYVISFDPCGSGGRVRRGGTGELGKTPPRTGAPYNLGTTKKAWPWSWGKVGVPYYCLHCCVWSEIMSVEIAGYPFRVTLYNDDPNAPCGWAYYKKPELIPEEYFTRLGFKKDVSKFRKV